MSRIFDEVYYYLKFEKDQLIKSGYPELLRSLYDYHGPSSQPLASRFRHTVFFTNFFSFLSYKTLMLGLKSFTLSSLMKYSFFSFFQFGIYLTLSWGWGQLIGVAGLISLELLSTNVIKYTTGQWKSTFIDESYFQGFKGPLGLIVYGGLTYLFPIFYSPLFLHVFIVSELPTPALFVATKTVKAINFATRQLSPLLTFSSAKEQTVQTLSAECQDPQQEKHTASSLDSGPGPF